MNKEETQNQTETEQNDETVAVEAEEVLEDNVTEEKAEETVEEPLTEEQQRIQELEAKIEELGQKNLRLQADYDNFRRRTREEQAASLKYKSQSLIEQLLPALDNFERALKTEAANEQVKTLIQGMDMVYRQLTDALKQEGLTEVPAVGEKFDPNLHQAVMQVEDSEYESNTVIEELQKGYMLKDRVIRPAMVKVNA
ncbi:nucleotide exchange factor GrpE [Fictibacillus phosphorivorans]|uniref:nucleotide exchange factor GrpE n=1 Tax=Fictibacillus phosphorivorans TaxID=1221500 RepID=UPI00203F3BC0|nr:nucleotide exchange factor GrpE [Fictibacillus phosphorivorans]MCM3716881.1 nucleotide exchange factor GrpE [Fictibacillus phosphorivorans]MCM3774570.1 nucleotide exchange factor GrpE [Fictibacillus phosphorivorans]